MGWLNLLFGIDRGSTSLEQDQEEIDREAAQFARDASDETVTTSTLANHHERSKLPLIIYLENDERPKFVFRGGELLVSTEDGSLAREHPTRETQVLISDQRLLFVVGNRRSDEVWGVEYDDIVDTYLDTESWQRYLVVDVEGDDQSPTFFADITLERNRESLHNGLEYLCSQWEDGSSDATESV